MNAALALAFAMKFLTAPAELRAQPARSVTILDARGSKEYDRGHIPGAIRIDWKDYRDGWFRTGKLPKDLDRLAGKMAKLGAPSRSRRSPRSPRTSARTRSPR